MDSSENIYQQEYQLWDEFLSRFPLEKLQTMPLEEYSQVGSKETFTWWVESGLEALGSIWGSPSFKFGIFASNNPDKEYKNQYKGDGQYAWYAKFGATSDTAFRRVRELIVEIAKAASTGDLEAIEKVDLSPNYKWKLAHLYQDREKPVALNIFKKDVLAHYLLLKTGKAPAKTTLASLHKEVMNQREGEDLLEYGAKVWREGSILKSYTTIKKDFFAHFPDFSTFIGPTDAYLTEERNYKQELCDIFAAEFLPRLSPLVSEEKEQLQVGKDLATLFRRKLVSEDAPQNLVGWRYAEFANKMSDDGYVAFARAVSDLIDPEISLDERIPNFISFLHRHSPDGKCGQAATRSVTTFFLFISDPKVHFFIKTEEVGKLLKLFSLDPFNNDSLAPEEYYRVQRLAREIYRLLEEDGLAPQDMIDVQSFFWSALSHNPEETSDSAPSPVAPLTSVDQQTGRAMNPYPLNQIFYGPPGTGKTYTTAQRAVEICDGTCPNDRPLLMQRYKALVADKRISFVSFHQSFSYEEFIEGIRPDLSGDSDVEQDQLIYRVEEGIFKKICSMAQAAIADVQSPATATVDLTGKKFYKMSVGGKYDPAVEAFCFEQGYLALGWGGDVDFTDVPKTGEWEPSANAIRQLMKKHDSEHVDKKFAVQAMFWFKSCMNVNDIIIVPRGLRHVQAIGQVTGEYEYRPELLPGLGYVHFRKVKWLVKDMSIPVEKIWGKQFSQQTLYSLAPAHLNMEYLEKLLGKKKDTSGVQEPERYVLIIDEINRANISKVLGELITLIEPDKRLDMPNEVTVNLPYSREKFGIPANLYIVGTMNTADRSLALMDTALRRRFEFEEMMPDYELLAGVEVGEIQIDKLLQTVNERIEALYDREHTIGHAFFMSLKDDPSIENLASIFANKIIPLLAEYFFEDWQKIRLVLGDNQKQGTPAAQFIWEKGLEGSGSVLFGNSTDLTMYGLDRVKQYVRNEKALNDPKAYVGIYNSAALKEE